MIRLYKAERTGRGTWDIAKIAEIAKIEKRARLPQRTPIRLPFRKLRVDQARLRNTKTEKEVVASERPCVPQDLMIHEIIHKAGCSIV